MRPWLETAGVVLLAAASAGVGVACGRLPKRLWLIGYALALLLLAAFGAVRLHYSLTFVPPFSWLWAGRREFIGLTIGCTLLLGTLVPKVRGKRLKALLIVLMAVCIYSFCVRPFLGPALVRNDLASLPTRVDGNGVCIQGTTYTCGPAAAVTALRKLGLPAEEGELAILARACPGTGTPEDFLCEALLARYAADGLQCHLRLMHTIDELRRTEATIVVIDHSPLFDHYVTVMEVTGSNVIVGDPLRGLRTLSHADFLDIWRNVCIALERR